jgi:hypothetical protein
LLSNRYNCLIGSRRTRHWRTRHLMSDDEHPGNIDRRTLAVQDPKFALEPKEREALARARADVKALVTASEEALNLCTQAPVPGSPLAIAVGSDIERFWVTTATSAINVSVDNLRALSVAWTAEQGVPHSAGYTLIRSATEAAARASWLATPGVSPRVRAARGIVEWDYSIECFRHLDEDGEHRRCCSMSSGIWTLFAARRSEC